MAVWYILYQKNKFNKLNGMIQLTFCMAYVVDVVAGVSSSKKSHVHAIISEKICIDVTYMYCNVVCGGGEQM